MELCRINCRQFLKTSQRILKNKKVRVYFAVKANAISNIHRLIFSEGMGAEVITDTELAKALASQASVVVNGHCKSDAMIQQAIATNADMINVESIPELNRVEAIAKALSKFQVSVGIRVQIKENGKLGFSPEGLSHIEKTGCSHCHIRGLHYHAGWNIREEDVIRKNMEKILVCHRILSERGYYIDTINLGGSFCEPTEDEGQLSRRMELYHAMLPTSVPYIHFEPGRYLVGNCGTLEASVVEIRNGHYCLNSCAYGYCLTNATKRIILIPKRYRPKDYPKQVVFSGHWPCEEDVVTVENLEYTPKIGDIVSFHNFGAYCDEWKRQFEFNSGLDYSFDTNFHKISQKLANIEANVIHTHWDYLRDQFSEIPKKLPQKKIVLKALHHLFLEKDDYTEAEVNQILKAYHEDFCMLRRDLADFGYLNRWENKYTGART